MGISDVIFDEIYSPEILFYFGLLRSYLILYVSISFVFPQFIIHFILYLVRVPHRSGSLAYRVELKKISCKSTKQSSTILTPTVL